MKKSSMMFVLLALVIVSVLGSVMAVAAEGKTIVYWSMWSESEPQAQVLAEAIKSYEAATGNTVDVQWKGRTGIREGLQAALDAGTVIDLFDEDIDRVNVQWGKYLMDLDDLAKADNYEATALPSMISAVRNVAGGKLMTIPYQPNVFDVFYNKDIFKAAGVDAVPTTWAEFKDVCKKIKDAGYIPFTTDDAYVDTNFGYQLARYMGEDGVVDVVTNGKWDAPEVLKAAQDYEDLYKSGYLSETFGTAAWPTNQNGEFALGEAAMYLNGSWVPNETKDMTGPDFKWGTFAYPAVDGGKTGTEAANFGAQVFGINKDSKVGPEAFKLIETFTQGDFDKKLSEQSMGIPADSRNAEWPAQLADVKTIMDSLTVRYSWAAGVETNADMTPIIKENFQKLCTGALDAKGFVDAMVAASK